MNGIVRGLALWLALGRALAVACGGPETYDLTAPLDADADLLERVVDPSDGFERTPIDALRFLYPFRRAYPGRLGRQWREAYAWAQPRDCPVDAERFEAAAAAPAFGAVLQVARRVVAHTLELPAADAQACEILLRRAIEVLELAPLLAPLDAATRTAVLARPAPADVVARVSAPLRDALAIRDLDYAALAALAASAPAHPRQASLALVALQEAMHRDIPNGYADEIRANTPPETWLRLTRLHDEWLAAHPTHPFADLVRLSRVRLAYLQGQKDAAWQAILAVYPRHLGRTLREMRHLLLNDVVPDDLTAIERDPVLLTALVPHLAIDEGRWTRWWQRAVAAPTASWSANLQERLLAEAASLVTTGGALPAAFPTAAAGPTPLWRRLRLLALLAAGRTDEALTQAQALGGEPDDALFVAAVHLRRGDVAATARVPGLPDGMRHYLVRVLADDATLDGLTRADDAALRGEAVVTRAVRRLDRDGWAAGSAALAIDAPDLSKAWASAAPRAAATAPPARLAWARYLRDHGSELLGDEDVVWYRSINYRLFALRCRTCPADAPTTGDDPCALCGADARHDPAVPMPAAAEVAAVGRQLRAASARYRALLVYADWLRATPAGDPQLAAVLREADAVYNGLVNWDATNSPFWSQELAGSPAIEAIRAAGRRVRRH